MSQQIHFAPGLRDVPAILRRQRRKMAFAFLGVLAAVVIVTAAIPRVYRSESKLFVRLGRENVGLDATATMGQGPAVVVPQTRDAEINSVVELLKSRKLLEGVVDAIGPSVLLGKSETRDEAEVASADVSQTDGLWSRISPFDSAPLREKALRLLAKKLDVYAVAKTNVVCAAYEAGDPELAQRVVGELVRQYLELHVSQNRPAHSQEFFAAQADQLEARLGTTEEALRKLKNETGVASIESQQDVVVKRIGLLRTDFEQTNAMLAAARAEVDAIRDAVQEVPETLVLRETSGMANQGSDAMRAELYKLQLREQNLASKFTDEHVELKQIRAEIAGAQGALEEEERTRTQTTRGPNKNYEDLQLRLVSKSVELASLEAKSASLDGQLATARQELSTLNDNEVRLAQLSRQRDLDDAAFRKHSENLEQTRIDQALGAEGITNLNVVQPATLDFRPVTPNKRVNYMMGFVLALFVALGVGLAAEYRDQSLRTAEDVERLLNIPTLATVPQLQTAEARSGGSGRHDLSSR